MDVCDIEAVEAAAEKKAAQTEDSLRPPLVPSEKHNAAVPAASRKPRIREVASRYKSGVSAAPVSTPAPPRRFPSPKSGRTSSNPGASVPKRAQSAERRRPPSTTTSRYSASSSPSSRPSTPSSPFSRPATPVRDSVTETRSSTRRLFSGRTADGLWPSMRSLSSSFQSDSTALSVSKKDEAAVKSLKASTNVGPERKRTPLRGRNTSEQSENSRPMENSQARVVDQHRWPGVMGARLFANASSRSMDLTDKVNRSASMPIPTRGASPRRALISDGLGRGHSLDLTDKANRSASMPVPTRGVSPGTKIASGITGRGLQRSTSDASRQVSSDGSVRVELNVELDVNVSSQSLETPVSVARPSRTQSLPVQGFHRPSSPNKAVTTPMPGLRHPSSPNKSMPTLSSTTRGMMSPSRTRPSTPFSSSTNATIRTGVSSSVLNYIGDVRKGKKNVNQVEDAHHLRLLYNRNLQWCFVNAQSDAVSSMQKMTSEDTLYAVWKTTSELRDAVVLNRINLQQLRQEMKLDIILKEQITYLEDWAALEREHSNSLSGAIEALKASTLRLPITGGARADILAVRNAISSAVDVMQTMGSSVCHLLAKVEGIKSVASELSAVAAKERVMLDECRELLASAATMQVQESSLRTHLIQLRQGMYKLN